ncbi:MAG TPA: DNA polymerase IV [Candidatus Woesebacteria bacterium]|nr:DNA polymerase IV [Candidatus Woesebacteria bacterium]
MASLIKLDFNRAPSTVMHIDLNSCFASIEQQANPFLRHKPVAVAAYDTPSGCILAASIEAKRLGIKVGTRVKEGRLLCSDLIVRSPDSDKYRAVHLSLKRLLSEYTPRIVPKSIDEFVLDFAGTPAFQRGLFTVAKEIKDRIKKEIGDYLTVSIGIGPNRFLAKTASNLHKPDGLDEINQNNYLNVYHSLELMDLCGINRQNIIRLNTVGIYTVFDFFTADVTLLRAAFHSILSYHWFMRLRGWEIDDIDFDTKSFGHSYSLPKKLTSPEEMAPILAKLVEKVGFRMRHSNFQAKGVYLSLLYDNYQYFHEGKSLDQPIFDSRDIYRIAFRLLRHSSYKLPVKNLSISCFNLSPRSSLQLDLFQDTQRRENLVTALDDINDRWGNFVITPAIMANTEQFVHDRIGFGQIRGLV